MTEANPNQFSGTITIALLPQDKGQYVCQITPSFSDQSGKEIRAYGQTQEHAIAIALEQLADVYRQIAEESQNLDWDAVEQSNTGELIQKRYHVVLHYEQVAEAESKFEAMHNTLLGNTVVENAKIMVVEIDSDLPVEPVMR